MSAQRRVKEGKGGGRTGSWNLLEESEETSLYQLEWWALTLWRKATPLRHMSIVCLIQLADWAKIRRGVARVDFGKGRAQLVVIAGDRHLGAGN